LVENKGRKGAGGGKSLSAVFTRERSQMVRTGGGRSFGWGWGEAGSRERGRGANKKSHKSLMREFAKSKYQQKKRGGVRG